MPVKHSSRRSSQASASTKTQVSTKAKIGVLIAAVLALGLVAYGFGFLPFLEDPVKDEQSERVGDSGASRGFWEERDPEEAAQCQSSCQESYLKCKTYREVEDCIKEYEACSGVCSISSDNPEAASLDKPLEEAGSPPESGREGDSTWYTGVMIANGEHPESQILPSGPGRWYPAAQYRFDTAEEDAYLEALNVTVVGNPFPGVEVALAHEGRVKGWGVLHEPFSQGVMIDFSAEPILVRGAGTEIEVWVRPHPLLPAALSGAPTVDALGHVPVGHSFSVGLNQGMTSAPWDESYRGYLNIRARTASGTRLLVSPGEVRAGNTFYVRGAVPHVSAQSLPSTTLSPGTDADLFRVQIGSTANDRPVALKRMTFAIHYEHTGSFNADLNLSNFRLRRGSRDIPLSDLGIFDSQSRSLTLYGISVSSTRGATTTNHYVHVLFRDEEVVRGPGNVYTLHATVNSVSPGTRLEVKFVGADEVPTPVEVNGYVSSPYYAVPSVGLLMPGNYLDIDEPPNGGADVLAPFVWSDLLTGPRHSAEEGTDGGSPDWLGPGGLPGFETVQTLTR